MHIFNQYVNHVLEQKLKEQEKNYKRRIEDLEHKLVHVAKENAQVCKEIIALKEKVGQDIKRGKKPTQSKKQSMNRAYRKQMEEE